MAKDACMAKRFRQHVFLSQMGAPRHTRWPMLTLGLLANGTSFLLGAFSSAPGDIQLWWRKFLSVSTENASTSRDQHVSWSTTICWKPNSFTQRPISWLRERRRRRDYLGRLTQYIADCAVPLYQFLISVSRGAVLILINGTTGCPFRSRQKSLRRNR